MTLMNGGQLSPTPTHPQPEGNWQYKPEQSPHPPAPSLDEPRPASYQNGTTAETEVSWTASAFIAHEKGLGWYAVLGLGTILLDVGIYILLKDGLAIAAITFMAVILGVMASRKPRTVEYYIDASGLSIGSRFHPYSELKSFSIMDEGAVSSILFMPLKRFMPPINIYYDPNDEDRIIRVLSQYLPFEHQEPDIADRLARKVRF